MFALFVNNQNILRKLMQKYFKLSVSLYGFIYSFMNIHTVKFHELVKTKQFMFLILTSSGIPTGPEKYWKKHKTVFRTINYIINVILM